ncbi:hypothetical protein ACFX2H_014432 [Malus domestica]
MRRKKDEHGGGGRRRGGCREGRSSTTSFKTPVLTHLPSMYSTSPTPALILAPCRAFSRLRNLVGDDAAPIFVSRRQNGGGDPEVETEV